jgi:hypothetical protein
MTLVSHLRVAQSLLVTAKKKTTTKRTASVRALRIGYDLDDPITRDRAVAEIVVALAEARGNAIQAAAALEVSHRALLRWVEKTPELATKLEAIRVTYDHPDRRVKA